MSKYDQAFDPNILIGHCDVIARFSDCALYLDHGHQSSSFKAKCNDNKFICVTSHYAAAEFETRKRLRVL